MAWGQYHEVPYRSGIEEKILGPFSFYKLAWLLVGLVISNQLAKILPKLPFISDDIAFGLLARTHLLIPIAIALCFAYIKHPKTNLRLFDYLVVMYKLKKRRRTFHYYRSNMPRGEEIE